MLTRVIAANPSTNRWERREIGLGCSKDNKWFQGYQKSWVINTFPSPEVSMIKIIKLQSGTSVRAATSPEQGEQESLRWVWLMARWWSLYLDGPIACHHCRTDVSGFPTRKKLQSHPGMVRLLLPNGLLQRSALHGVGCQCLPTTQSALSNFPAIVPFAYQCRSQSL